MKGLKAKWNGASQLMRRTIVITVVMAVLSFIGVLTDPTTKGMGDSEQALTYEKPKE